MEETSWWLPTEGTDEEWQPDFQIPPPCFTVDFAQLAQMPYVCDENGYWEPVGFPAFSFLSVSDHGVFGDKSGEGIIDGSAEAAAIDDAICSTLLDSFFDSCNEDHKVQQKIMQESPCSGSLDDGSSDSTALDVAGGLSHAVLSESASEVSEWCNGGQSGDHNSTLDYWQAGWDEHATSSDTAIPSAAWNDSDDGEDLTMMLRGIPNKYNQQKLLERLNLDFRGQFDFLYLPIDFNNDCNVGYAFVNFRCAEAVHRFKKKFDGVDVHTCLPGLNSKKVTSVMSARIQGRSENISRLQRSPVMRNLSDRPEWQPVLLDRHGHLEPFPIPDTFAEEAMTRSSKLSSGGRSAKGSGKREGYNGTAASRSRR